MNGVGTRRVEGVGQEEKVEDNGGVRWEEGRGWWWRDVYEDGIYRGRFIICLITRIPAFFFSSVSFFFFV